MGRELQQSPCKRGGGCGLDEPRQSSVIATHLTFPIEACLSASILATASGSLGFRFSRGRAGTDGAGGAVSWSVMAGLWVFEWMSGGNGPVTDCFGGSCCDAGCYDGVSQRPGCHAPPSQSSQTTPARARGVATFTFDLLGSGVGGTL